MTWLWRLWQATATRAGDKTVVIDAGTGRAWTCAEIMIEADRRAAALRDGFFCLPNGAAWLIEFLACQRAGLAAVPLDPTLPADAQARIRSRLNRGRTRSVGSGAVRRPGRTAARPACFKLTSGTTGDLKPIACSSAQLEADGRQICRTMGIRAHDVNLAIIPLGHSYGLGNLVMPLLLQGTGMVCAQTFVPRQIVQLIEKYRISVFPAVPAILRALAQLERATKPPGLRLVISAGAPLPADVARQFHSRFGVRIHNFYGSSETGGICYDRTGNAALSGRGVGKPVGGVSVRVRRDGRVAVKSRAGSATLPDLGEWNRYGELRLIGRVGEMANIGGRKVSPAEVEACLRQVAGVADAWVTVLRDARGDDYLAAAVETRLDRAALEGRLLAVLPLWKLPRRYFISETLPRTNRGKLHTAELRERLSVSRP
jgi:acyl-CoA synthetase (AMP-forming)/AMP-acid ligase II